MPEHFISLLDRIYPQEEAVKEFLRQHMKPKSYPKGHLLLHTGEVNDRLYFIERGAARTYELRNGEAFSTWFMLEGDIVMVPESFYTRSPSYEAIELLEDSEVFELHRYSIDILLQEHLCLNFAGRVIVEMAHVQVVKQFREVRVFSKMERYLSLIARWPELFNRVPAKHIASFLGMHEKTLIRTRASAAKKKAK